MDLKLLPLQSGKWEKSIENLLVPHQIASGQGLPSFKTEGTSLRRGLLGEIGLFFSDFSEGHIT